MINLAEYLDGPDVLPTFDKVFISIFNDWLGSDNNHKLDSVTTSDWDKFNSFHIDLYKNYPLNQLDWSSMSLKVIKQSTELFINFEEIKNNSSDKFLRLIINSKNIYYEEHWDFTSILWFKNFHDAIDICNIAKNNGLHIIYPKNTVQQLNAPEPLMRPGDF